MARPATLPTRRALIAAALAGLAPAAKAQAPEAFSAVSVDVGPLRAKGLGPYAERVRTILQAELASAFSDRLRPGGPRLLVRIAGISMPAYVGGERRFIGGGPPNDYLEGEALVLGPRGEILLRHPQLSAVPASSGGAWYLPDNEDRRLQALCAHYAGWLRRAL